MIQTKKLIVITVVIGILLGVGIFFLTYKPLDCPDVVHTSVSPAHDRWAVDDADGKPYIQNVRDYPAGQQWHLYYQAKSGQWTLVQYPTLDGLKTDVPVVSLLDEADRGKIFHLIECIKAGCPGCD